MTTSGIVVSSVGGIDIAVGSAVNTNRDPGHETGRNVLAVEVDKLRERVVVVLGLVGSPHVLVVGCNLDRVGVVRVRVLDSRTQRLVEEELANVGDRAEGRGAVGKQLGADVGNDVLVGGAALVVT